MVEKNSKTGSVMVKGIIGVVILTTLLMIYLTIVLLYEGNTFR